MERSEQILKKYKFSEETLKIIGRKTTEKGILEVLSSERAVREAIPDSETAFRLMFEPMRLKSNDTCVCGRAISSSYRKTGKYKFRCQCGKYISPLSQTPFKKMKMPLEYVFYGVYDIFQNKRGIPTAVINRKWNWKYKITLNLRWKIMTWMKLFIDQKMFSSVNPIEIDEVYPKIPTGMGRKIRLSRGLGSERLKPVLVLTQRVTGITKGNVLGEARQYTVNPIIDKVVPKGTLIYTDSSKLYSSLNREYKHHTCNHNIHQWAVGDVHVNTSECFNETLKTKIHRIHRGVSEEKLQMYIDEMSFQFSSRYKDIYEVFEDLLSALPSLFEKNYPTI